MTNEILIEKERYELMSKIRELSEMHRTEKRKRQELDTQLMVYKHMEQVKQQKEKLGVLDG